MPRTAGADPSPTERVYPEALTVALEQMAEALRASGAETLKKLFDSTDPYPKVVLAIEKLCSCALEWQELRRAAEKSKAHSSSKGGMSDETLGQLTLKLEGPQT